MKKIKIKKDNNYYNNASALVGTIMVGLITILTNYAKRLGSNDFQLTLLTSLPALVAFCVLIPGAYFVDKAKNKIGMAVSMALVSRLFLLFYALVPLLPLVWQPFVLVILVGLRNAPESIWSVAYQSIISDIFEYSDLAQVMSIRNRIANIAQLATIIILSQVMHYLNSASYNMVTALQLVFIVSAIFGFWEISYYHKLRPKQVNKQADKKFMEIFKEVIHKLPKQHRFLAYAKTVLPFYMAWLFPPALFNIHAFDYYQANEKWMTYMGIISTLAAVAALPWWRRLIEKKGNSHCLLLGVISMSFSPLIYAFAPDILTLTILQAVPGFATAGITLLFFNLLIEMTPEKQKTTYMALFTTLVNLITFVMPLTCAALMPSFTAQQLLLFAFFIRLVAGVWVATRNKQLYKKENLAE